MRIRIPLVCLATFLLFSTAAGAQPSGRRRAVLVGINDYSASHLGTTPRNSGSRDLPHLNGAVNDTTLMAEMLSLLYGFDRRDIVTLTDQSATREAILGAIEQHLVTPAAKGDVLLFYFAGHGSQVRNSLSDERDKLDESIVPADSRIGASDIRDKELRVLFNRILDRGARLTVILDNCHSGSGARGLATGARPRGVRPDLRDVADGTKAGPRPENRGALVLTASSDSDSAWETQDAAKQFHGAFSWALLRAMRDSSPDEMAFETFARARARLRGETPYQQPVMAGNSEARLSPLLGARIDRRGDRVTVGIEKVRDDGTVVLLGGWANGLSVGTELRLAGETRTNCRLKVTEIHGLSQCEARNEISRPLPLAIHPGALLEVVGWAAPPGRALRVWMPRWQASVKVLTQLARAMVDEAEERSVRWISDPVDTTPTHLLRVNSRGWELLGPDSEIEHLGSDEAAVAAIAKLPRTSSLFVQFPAPAGMIDGISVGPGTDRDGIEPVDEPQNADYILAGRFSAGKLAYSWVRPAVRHGDRRCTGLPLRTAWLVTDAHRESLGDIVPAMREMIVRLRRIYAWNVLESPPEARNAYRLGIRRNRDDNMVYEGRVMGEEPYTLFLCASLPTPPKIPQRYVYVFGIDSYGHSELLYPLEGSVENRFPPPPTQTTDYPPLEIELQGVDVGPPYGIDTYFLLSTDEPLPNPWVLTWDGVRGRGADALDELSKLLVDTGCSTRAPSRVTRQGWSIQKLVVESVPPRKTQKRRRGV